MKQIYLLGLIALLLACQPVQTNLPQAAIVHTGTGGLEIEIIEGAPPEMIVVGEPQNPTPFDLAVTLRNRGAYDISNGKLSVSYDQKLNSIHPSNPYTFTLEGKKSFLIDGDFDTRSWSAENIGLPVNKRTVFVISGCYQYRTEAAADVCIGPPVLQPLQITTSACNPKDYATIALSGGQGAPVAITQIRESVRPRQDNYYDVVFAIDIDNLGNGHVRSKEAFDRECIEQRQLDIGNVSTVEVKEISFSDYSLSNGRIECEPAKLRVGERTIVCKATIDKFDAPSAFISSLQIVLEYGYVTRVYPVIEVKERSEI